MRRLLLILLSLISLRAMAGGDPLTVGARFAGMGGSGLTLADLWSVRLNPAGLAGLEAPTAGLFYQRHYLSEDLAHQGLAVALPVGKGCFGLGADRFGYDLYNETRASLAYAMRFGEGLRAGIAETLDRNGIDGQVTGAGSLFTIHFHDRTLVDYRSSILTREEQSFATSVHRAMLTNGILFSTGIAGCLSTPMSESDLVAFTEALNQSIEDARGTVDRR